MRRWLHQLAQWRAETGRQLNENDVWRQVTEFSAMVCLPVVWLARKTLLLFPGLKKLEWLLEIDALTRRNSVVLALSLLFVFWRGIMTTPLGHIGTDKLIYPTLGALSGFNPFLGMLCGAAYGVADLIQKFWWPDMYGANGWFDLNYWGAMVGYCVTYLTIMGMGLFPGMASRACRAGVVKIVSGFAAKRATQMADGGVPLGAAVSPVLEMLAAATGGIATGWAIMHQAAPITTMPAFLWRPNPDVSCWQLEVDTHLKGYAVAGGAGAALGGVANVVVPPPQDAPPEIPDEFEWTFPNGVTTVVRKDEDGQYINILTGGVVDVTNLEGWKQSWGNIIDEQGKWAEEQRIKLQNRDTDFDRFIDEQVAEQKLKDKVWENLAQMQRNILTGDGPESHLYKPPGEPGNILDHIRNLQNQLLSNKPLDRDQYQKIYDVYRKQKEGRILQPSQIPAESELNRDIFNNTLKNTAGEFITGTDADGNTSWLGIAGRGLTAVVTAGGSEFVLVPANTLNTMKNYVDSGGDSALEGFKHAVVTVLVDELTGRAVGKGLNLAGKGGGFIVKTGSDLVKEAAERGSSVAKSIVKAAQHGGKAAKAISKAATTPIKSKPPSVSSVARAPKTVTPDAGKWIRDANRAGSTNVRTVPAGKSPAQVATGFTEKQVKHIRNVSDKYGVKIDVRPTNPHSEAWIKSGKGVPKPAYIKTKTLTPMDELLGAKGAPGQTGYYRPKLPPKGSMTDGTYNDLKKLYAQRMKEFKAERGSIQKAVKSGKAYVKDGVVYNGKPPNGKPFVGDVDVFDVRDPITGRPLPRYQVDHKGNLVMDPKTGQPKLNPVRQAVVDELGAGPCQTQHGTHMDWKYDHNQPKMGAPPDPKAASQFAHDHKIDQGVLNKHRPGGEPLVSYGPNGGTEAVYIEGGR